mmetsp:Transcript_17501/g.28318  ORF Transcript_17501/g.28318 Transcript_17501/m.28318 type:complete len:525 (-) Transcript_17501:311-1885(-)
MNIKVTAYFRPTFLIALVWFLWGVNVWVFKKCGIDYAGALGFDKSSTLNPRQICSSALIIGGIYFMLWLLYSFQWPVAGSLFIPAGMYFASFLCILLPLDIFHQKGREKLGRVFYAMLLPPVTGVLFVEVVLGDILTSLSKALADFQVTLCVLLSHSFSSSEVYISEDELSFGVIRQGGGLVKSPAAMILDYEHRCSETWMRPFVTSIPFLIRFRQCIVAYRATGDAFPHLVNACKYLSALPVIWISAVAHHFPLAYGVNLRKIWLIAISFNSIFSFLWDVVMDWGLCQHKTKYPFLREKLVYMKNGYLFRQESWSDYSDDDSPARSTRMLKYKHSHNPNEPQVYSSKDRLSPNMKARTDDNIMTSVWHRLSARVSGLKCLARGRKHGFTALHFNMGKIQPLLPPTPIAYYVAIVLDFLLRVLWSFKLSVHLQLSQEGLTFMLEICEVVRRFLWLFLRIEWAALSQEEAALASDIGESDSDENTSIGLESSDDDFPLTVWGPSSPSGPSMRSRTHSDRLDTDSS